MSALHLGHKISWANLAQCFTTYKDCGIALPIGVCGRIHAKERKTKIQLQNRLYLADQVCNDEDCAEKNKTKIFRKKNTSYLNLNKRWYNKACEKSYEIFMYSFVKAVLEFAKTERKKVKRNVISTQDYKTVIENLKERNLWVNETELMLWCSCRKCQVFSILIEAGDTATLFSFSDEQIRDVLCCQHGGQAVGNNFNFLSYHVLKVYKYTNLIALTGLQNQPNEWGPMKQGQCFRESLSYDCDGQTFLYSSRKFLSPDVYMKDWQAMKQLCKNCFQFLYFVEMLQEEVIPDWTEESLRYRLEFL